MKMNDKTEGLFNFMDLRQPKYKAAYGIIFAVLILLSLISLFPIIWYMTLGFKDVREIHAIPATLFPKHIDLSRVGKVWKSVSLGTYFVNTLYLIVGCWASAIVFNGMCGYFLSKIRAKGYNILNVIVFWTILMPGVSVVPLYCWLADVPFIHVNLLGNRLPIMLMTGASAFDILLFRNFFNGIPTEYMEAARIDGCSTSKNAAAFKADNRRGVNKRSPRNMAEFFLAVPCSRKYRQGTAFGIHLRTYKIDNHDGE